jgi:hypothetical protein
LAERELAAEKRQASNSLVSRLFSSHKKTESKPSWAGTPLLELRQVLQENHPEGRARSLLRLAERYAYDRKYPELTAGLLKAAEKEPALAGEVRELRELMSGGGPLLRQLRYEGTHLWNELTSPIALASFGAAVWSARLASAWVVGRSAGYGLGTWAASEAAALAVEVPTMVLSRRVGLAAFVGGENLFSPESIGQELLASYGPFAMLRGGSNLFALSAPWLKAAYGLEGAGGKALLGTTRFGLELGGVLSGHGINGFLGVENPLPLTENTVLSGLMTVGYMRAAGMTLNGLRRYGAPVDVAGEKRARWAEELHRRGTDWLDGMGAVGDFFSGRRLNYAGTGRDLSVLNSSRWFSKSEGSDETGQRSAAVVGLGQARIRSENRRGGPVAQAVDPLQRWGALFNSNNSYRALQDFFEQWAGKVGLPSVGEIVLINQQFQPLPEYFIDYLAVLAKQQPRVARALLVYLRLVPEGSSFVGDSEVRGELWRQSEKQLKPEELGELLNRPLDLYETWGRQNYPENFPNHEVFDRVEAAQALRKLPVIILHSLAEVSHAEATPLFFLFHRLGISDLPPPDHKLVFPTPEKWHE